jgi:lipoprotein NlpI
MNRIKILALVQLFLCPLLLAQEPPPGEAIEAILGAARAAEDSGDYDEAVAQYTAALKQRPDAKPIYQARGVAYFMAGKMVESISDFDTYLAAYPRREPHHWQRGLAYYYAGEFQKGRAQFETHQDVNSNDVENAVWHFLCVAKLEGVEKARENLIPIVGDSRVPMKEVQLLFAGKGTADEVLAAARAGDPAKDRLRNNLCYANLYLGLYYEAIGEVEKSAKHMKEAATTYRMKHYMGEVPRVHRLIRAAEKKAKATKAAKDGRAESGVE